MLLAWEDRFSGGVEPYKYIYTSDHMHQQCGQFFGGEEGYEILHRFYLHDVVKINRSISYIIGKIAAYASMVQKIF
jgi:hypothetical protein